MQITSDIARINKDITEFQIIDNKYFPIFQIKRTMLLKLTIKKLVKDKIIYKKNNLLYIFGTKFNSYSDIYKKIIEYWGNNPTYNYSQKRDIEIIIMKNNEIITKRNNYKTYQNFLNHKLMKAKELKAIYESQRKINIKKPIVKDQKSMK
jgi:hypothetical protein